MLFLDFKDFRVMSDYPVPLVEQDIEDALVEAGVKFDTPMGLRIRIKDLDERMLLAKGDAVDEHGDEYRLNLYFPPWIPQEAYLIALNARVRHVLKHVAQSRVTRTEDPRESFDSYDEWVMHCETEAQMHASAGACDILREDQF